MTVQQLINRLELLSKEIKDYEVVIYDKRSDMFKGVFNLCVLDDKDMQLELLVDS